MATNKSDDRKMSSALASRIQLHFTKNKRTKQEMTPRNAHCVNLIKFFEVKMIRGRQKFEKQKRKSLYVTFCLDFLKLKPLIC